MIGALFTEVRAGGVVVDAAELARLTAGGWWDQSLAVAGQYNVTARFHGRHVPANLTRTNHPKYWRFYLKRGGALAACWTVEKPS